MNNIKLTAAPRPVIALAPMAGATCGAFRAICAAHGATHATTEMISAKAIHYGDQKTAALFDLSRDICPVSVQLFGSEPDIMAEAAQKILAAQPKLLAIDINAGCPMPKITKNGEGSALMKNPALLHDIVRAVARAVDRPVTVKIRSGWDGKRKNAVEAALACEAAGATTIAVHGRTREQLYAPPVDLEIISAVKRAVSVPVIGNGGIASGQNARLMLDRTGCDGVMIGQAAMGNPWIFGEIAAALSGEPYEAPTAEQKIDGAIAHLRALVEEKGELIGVREARGQLGHYLRGIVGGAAARSALTRCIRAEEMSAVLEKIKG